MVDAPKRLRREGGQASGNKRPGKPAAAPRTTADLSGNTGPNARGDSPGRRAWPAASLERSASGVPESSAHFDRELWSRRSRGAPTA